MPEFRTQLELDIALKSVLKEVIENVAKRAEKKIKKSIDDLIYIPNQNHYYYDTNKKPTGQFQESVDSTRPKTFGNGYEVEVYHNKNKMQLDTDTFLHGSNYPSPNDVRDFLAEIINEGKAGNLFGSGFWTEARPYWDKSMQDLVDNRELDKYFQEEFLKKGIVIVKGY